MRTGPQVKLTVNLQKIWMYFPQDADSSSGFDFDMAIDRPRYYAVGSYLLKKGIRDPQVIQEFCFIILWIENYIGVFTDRETYPPKFKKMWEELDGLKEYLLQNRVTSITLMGEHDRNTTGKDFIIREEINIDRVCDGIRSVFREEFLSDKDSRKTRGKKAWKSRKMVKVNNYVLNYLSKVPGIDRLSLEEQSRILSKLSYWAGVS